MNHTVHFLFLVLSIFSFASTSDNCPSIDSSSFPPPHPLIEPFFFGSQGNFHSFSCPLCIMLVNALENYTITNNLNIDEFISKDYCKLFDKALEDICQKSLSIHGFQLISALRKSSNPDDICKQIGFCRKSECSLYPKDKSHEIKFSSNPFAPYSSCLEPSLEYSEVSLYIDKDKDSFSSVTSIYRGYNWKGRDCDDNDENIYPGRKKDPYPGRSSDYNCNGVSGFDPQSGKTYKELFCDNTNQMGVIVAGDSVGARFQLPKDWADSEYWRDRIFKDLLPRLQDNFNVPQYSAFTGFCPEDGPKPCRSIYKYLYERNKCNFRDYHNIAVNGGTLTNTLRNLQVLKREEGKDYPVLMFLELLGNDICGPVMTTPEEFRENFIEILDYLDSRLPSGSHLVVIGVIEDDIYKRIYNKIHPAGVTYEEFYSFGRCLGAPSCPALLNPIENLRKSRIEGAKKLNEVYRDVLSRYNAKKFDTIYYDFPIEDILLDLVKEERDTVEVFDPVDGFHPSQMLNALLADHLWESLLRDRPQWFGEVNPHNSKIEELFGNQGGH